MPSEKLNIQPISSWFYNCGLGTLVPHLLVYLSPKVSSLAKFAEEPPMQLMRERFEKSQGYKLLRESFLELYISDKEERTIIIKENKFEDILSNLFETYAKATEQTIILGPVLRLTLQKVLDENKNSKDKLNDFKDKLWPYFKVLVLNCLKHVQSNSNNTIENYKWQDTEKILFVPNKKTITAIVSILKNSKNSNSSRYTYYNEAFQQASCPEFFSKKWEQVLEKSYSYLGSAEIPVFLPIEYLGELYRSFGFRLLYT